MVGRFQSTHGSLSFNPFYDLQTKVEKQEYCFLTFFVGIFKTNLKAQC